MANILALTAGDWNTGSNWDGGNVPGISDVAVMNGKTMTLPNNGVITCSKITSDSALGLPNGFVSLLVSDDSTLTFTINANLERTGVVSASLVQLSTASISNKDVTVNITGNIVSRGTSAQGGTVFLNASSAAAPLTITANVVGNCIAGGSQANSPAISVASTYGDITINVTGNVLYEGTAANYGVSCNNSQGFGKVTVSGYVMCSGHSSVASVNIAGTTSDASFVTVGAGIIPGGVGAGVRIDRGMGTVINAAPDGVAIRPGIGSGGLSLGSSQSSVTINGDVMAGVTNTGISIASPTSATQLRQITVNGNLRSDTGVSGSGGSSQIVSISGCVFLTVNGDIDATYSDTTSGSYLPVTMANVQGVNSGLVVSGDILSATGGSTSGLKTVSITTGASPGMNQITVGGTVYGTPNGVGISSAVISIIQNVSISKVTVTTMMPFAKAYGAIENIVPVGYLDILDEYDYGVDGVSPLRNCGKVRFADTVVFKYNSVDNTPRTASLANSAAIIPATANVRSGVTVGYGTGTLIVPQAANVLAGVVYDGGTVGTLSAGGGVDLSSVQAVVDAIKTKTDQLVFVSGNLQAEVTNPPSIIDSVTAVTDGSWNDASIWSPATVPDATKFVYTNGKQVIVDGTVECAGLSDTVDTGGLILDSGGNAALVSAYGDPYLANIVAMRTLDGASSPSYGSTANLTTVGGSFVADPIGGNTEVWQSSNDVSSYNNIYFPTMTATENLTLEFMWKPNIALASSPRVYMHSPYANYICNLSPNSNTFSSGSTYGGNPFYCSTGVAFTGITWANVDMYAWHHVVIQKNSTTTYIWFDGALIWSHNQTSSTARDTAMYWRLTGNSGSRFAHIRWTVGLSRYSGNPYAGYVIPFLVYAPAPGSTLSGRVVLGTNGAVVQHGASPVKSTAGLLSSIRSSLLSTRDRIGAKTDQLTFGSTGVVTEGGSGSGTDYTSRFDDLDLAVAAIPTLTYTARLNSIDTDLGNLIANNMRNNLVAGIVGSTGFIGLWDDTSTELSGGTPAYQRQAVVWSAPFNGIVTNTTDITINVPAGGTVAYIAGYTLVTGGTAQFSYACTEVDAVSQSVYTIPAGTLQMITTVQ